MIDQDRVGRQAGTGGSDDLLDHRVVLEYQVHPGCAPNRVGRRGGGLDAELRELPDFLRRAVPRRDGVAAFGGSLGEGAAEESGAEKCDCCHGHPPEKSMVACAA